MSITHVLCAHITYSVGMHDIYWNDTFPDIGKLNVHYFWGRNINQKRRSELTDFIMQNQTNKQNQKTLCLLDLKKKMNKTTDLRGL